VVLDLQEPEPAPDHSVAAVLRITAFRRLWLALGVSSFGDWLGLLATTSMAKTLAEGSYAKQNLAIAGVLILRLAPAVLLGPLAGALADRLNRRWTMVTGDVLRCALFISIPLIGTLPWLFTATVLIESAALFWMPAKDATVPNLVPRRRLEAANQVSLATTYGTAPLAAIAFSGLALLNGILDNFLSRLATNPVELALYVDALTFLVSAATIAMLDIPPRRTSEQQVRRTSLWRSIVDGWMFVGTTPVVRGLVLGMLGAFAAAGCAIGLAATYVGDLGAGQPGYGALFGAVFTGLAAGMWAGPRVLAEFSRRRMFGIALTCAGVFLTALALIPNIVMAVLLAAGLGACGGVAWVTGYTLLGLEVDDAVRGRTFGFLTSAARVVLVLVLAAAPTLAAVIGAHHVALSDEYVIHYNGAAFVFLFGGLLAITMGIAAFRQMDDKPGAGLVSDLREAWAGRLRSPGTSGRGGLPGVFIAFEGGDGTGKSTQAGLLAEWLREDQGHEVVLTREPGATPMGRRLREALLDAGTHLAPRAETLLFAADRADHVATLVRPALERGAVVITDRYVDSSIAYQGAGRNQDSEEVARLSRWATAGLVPDLTVLLDAEPEIARARLAGDGARDGEDRLEALPEDFHERVRRRFLELARREPHRYLIVDASQSVEEIHWTIRARVRDMVPISQKRRAELAARLAEEEEARQRQAAVEAEVLRMDAELRARQQQRPRRRRPEGDGAGAQADGAGAGEAPPALSGPAVAAARAAAAASPLPAADPPPGPDPAEPA